VYPYVKPGTIRHREMLARAERMRQQRQLRAVSKASRRVERARKRLSQAQRDARRVSRELRGSWV